MYTRKIYYCAELTCDFVPLVPLSLLGYEMMNVAEGI